MTYYVVYIFQMASLTGNTGLVSSGVQYALFIIGTAATFFFIDKTGRRSLLVSFYLFLLSLHRLTHITLRFTVLLVWASACSLSEASLVHTGLISQEV